MSKAQHYSAHINGELLPALRATEHAIAQIERDIAEYAQLAESLEALQSKTEASKAHSTMTELGGGVWVDAIIPDTSSVTVDIGLDVHIDVSLQEAIPLAKRRGEVLLKKQTILLKRREAIEWQIAQFQGAIAEASGEQPRLEPVPGF